MNSKLDELIGRAARAQAAGRLPEAESLAGQALEIEPENVQALLLLGVVESKTGRFASAAGHLEFVAKRDPSSFHARMWLSRTYVQLRRIEEAIAPAAEAARLNPNDPSVLTHLGLCLVETNRYDPAIQTLQRAANIAPKVADVHEALGRAWLGKGELKRAIRAFELAISLDPKSESAGVRLAEAFLELPDAPRAEECSRGLSIRFPKSAALRAILARALLDQGRGSEALVTSQAAIALDPSRASAYVTDGLILQSLGRMAESGARFEKAIEIDPRQGFAYSALAHGRKIRKEDAGLVSAMERLSADGSLPPWQHCQLQYGLGKAYQDLGEFERAMARFDEANRIALHLKFGDGKFDRDAYLAGIEFVLGKFTPEFMRRHASWRIESDVPIFVVGMMRSGTTLVEQILSSHSKVGAAGEQRFWMDRRAEAFKNGGNEFDGAAVSRLAGQYVRMLREIVADRPHVVDKMPVNYSLIGLIHLAMPNARFIHIKRHPVDNCLSIYTTPNRSRVDWTNDRANIVFAFRQYERLMDRWNGLDLGGRTLELQYEDLIQDQEQTTRKLIAFCGLDWEDGCLFPERNDRAVLTPSVWQVRQPVYRTSLERWRDYEPWLREFAELL